MRAISNVHAGRVWASGRKFHTPGVKRQYSLLGVLNVKLAHMTSCARPEVRRPLDQRILCCDCCEKNALWLTQPVFSYFVLNRSKKPLVLKTKVTYANHTLNSKNDSKLVGTSFSNIFEK